jgi:hypothetical protein
MWKYLLRVVVAVSKNPAVRAWAIKKAAEVVEKIKSKAEAKAEAVRAAVLPAAEDRQE